MILLMLIIGFLGTLASFWKSQSRYVAQFTIYMLGFIGFFSALLFEYGFKGMQFIYDVHLLDLIGVDVRFHLGVDGISFAMVLLTIVLGIAAVLVSEREIHKNQRFYYPVLLGLITATVGVFSSLDLVIFFLFWEVILVLMFLLIARWGGENAQYASMRFLLYTGLGSAGLLFAIIILAVNLGTVNMLGLSGLSSELQLLVFCLLLFAFFVKIPVVPFHTWLPDAHVQAPTAGSILLAGVLLKMGAYGLLRIGTGVMPSLSYEMKIFLFIMGTVTILYGGLVCLAQTNIKRLIAYSSVNHMGIVVLGIATGSSLGVTGAVFEMVSHGLLAALLFGLAGLVHERTGTFELSALHGLVQKMPRSTWLFVIAALGGMGLPTMTGFIAEVIVFIASFAEFGLLSLIPIAGVLITGAYMVRLITKGFFGTPSSIMASEDDVSFIPFALLLLFTFLLGLLPFLLIKMIQSSVIA